LKVSVADILVFDAIKGVVSEMKKECITCGPVVEIVMKNKPEEDEESITIGDELTRIWHAKNPVVGEFVWCQNNPIGSEFIFCHKDSNSKETETSFAQEAYYVFWSSLVRKINNGKT
jgi:hypothetical protein